MRKQLERLRVPNLWDSKSLGDALGQNLGQLKLEASGISIDTRSLAAGDIFIALQGERLDGAQFMDEAFAKGAVAVISEKASEKQKAAHKEKIILVANCQKALEQLALFARTRTKAKVIAVTGSVGKTGVKDSLADVLGAYRAPKSFNNHWGVPLTLARMAANEKFAVIEMGMNHAGEIAALTKLAQPDLAIITQISPAHIGFFNGLKEIAAAKAEIFLGLKEGGVALLNRDDEFFFLLERTARERTDKVFTFGTGAKADGRFIDLAVNETGAKVTAEIFGAQVSFSQYIPAKALALNNIAVLTAAHLLGTDLASAAEKIGDLVPREGRGLRELFAEMILIDESYNANPASMAVALESLGALASASAPARAVAVLGDVAELGRHAQAYHKALLKPLTQNADVVFLCGEEMKSLYDSLPAEKQGGFGTADALLKIIPSKLKKGDRILFKASQKMGFSKLIAQLKEVL